MSTPFECSDWSNGRFCLGNYQHDMVLKQSEAHPLYRGRYYTDDPPRPSFCKSTKHSFTQVIQSFSIVHTSSPHLNIFGGKERKEIGSKILWGKPWQLAKIVDYHCNEAIKTFYQKWQGAFDLFKSQHFEEIWVGWV